MNSVGNWSRNHVVTGGIEMKNDSTQTKLKKFIRAGLVVCSLAFVGLAYQNCSQPTTGFQNSGSSSLSSLSSEDDLFSMLQEARELSSLLNTYDLSKDTASDILKQAPTISRQLTAKADLIEKAITVDGTATNSNVVLKEVDSLVNLLSQARDVRVAYDSIRRDALLSLRVDGIETKLNQTIDDLAKLSNAFGAFKTAMTSRVDALVEKMNVWQDRLNAVDKAIADVAASGKAQDLALKAALEQLKTYTETELAGVKQNSQDLQADLDKQKAAAALTQAQIDQANAEMAKLGDIAGRLCKYDASGAISDTRAQCSTSSQANCCLTVNVIDCSSMFASAPAALNQCSILVTVIKNHDQQLQAIQAVDEKQNAAIDQINLSIGSLINDVSTINSNISTLADGLNKVKAVTDELAAQVSSIKDTMKQNDDATKAKLADLDTRTMLLEFKANRAEIINGLQARANATLAWSVLRYAQINGEFCQNRRNQALAVFDYKAARQNIEFCIEKRAIANLAQSMASVANAYAGILGSLNVDSDCSQTVNGKPASTLTNTELMDDATLKSVTSKCTNGGQVVAKALILNIVRYLKQIGPDFRTYQSMGAVSKSVNIAFFGSDWASVSTDQQKAFDNIDPTSDALKNTPFGQVERLFLNNYYAFAFRDANGKFISDPTKVNVKVPSSVYTEKQLLTGAQVGKNLPDYVQRVRALEAQGFCSDCGFKITGRANPDSNKSSLVISHGSGSRFYYPNDSRPDLCPVDDDVVIRQKDGKHVVYHLSFDSWGNDILTPSLYQGLPVVIANSDTDLQKGNFNSCDYQNDVKVERSGMDTASIPTRLTIRATRPYGSSYGRPQCTKLTAVCAVKDGEWKAPIEQSLVINDLQKPETMNVLTRYLTGFNPDVINYMCSVQAPAYGAPTPSYTNSRNIASIDANRGIKNVWADPNGFNASSRSQGYIVDKSTQLLGSAYWPFQDGPLPYTAEKISKGQDNAFAIVAGSSVLSATNYVREVEPVGSINAQECSHCPANLHMLGGCALPPPVQTLPPEPAI
jgi:hypothetical protein